MTIVKEYLFVEKYRPKKIDDCVLPENIKQTFKDMIARGESQNLLLSGGPGCGKTTVAKALCHELDTDYIVINCSEDGNIDTLRTTIRNFASTVSLSGGKKVVILDEFDYSNAQSTQPALRGFIEEFSKNCRFIMTCNYKNKIIEPLHSRCTPIEFRMTSKDKPLLAKQFLDRCKYILEQEKIPYDEKVIAQLILKHFPDYRRILNELQRYSVSGKIDVGILANLADVKIKDLFKNMKSKQFGDVRKWVVSNLDNDATHIFRTIYDGLSDHMKPTSIPAAILIIAEYSYKNAFVVDTEINLTACLTELMLECEFL